MDIVHISNGGPILEISVGGRIFRFEDHPHCGPIAIGRTGDALLNQPPRFLRAVSQWYQQGKLIKDGLCVWFSDSIPITERQGRRDVVIGWKPPVQGK